MLGQTHFIKTVEDVYEAIVNTVPGMKFGVASTKLPVPASRAWMATTPASRW